MYTNNNNSNNDKDGEEKRFTPLMIKKNNGHQNPPPHRRKKLELDKVLKVEILEIRLIASLIFNFFLFCFPTNVFNRKTMSLQQKVYD